MLEHFNTIAGLREEREVLGTAEQIAGIGSWSLDLTSGRQFCSPGLLRLLELQPESIATGSVAWLGALQPDDIATAKNHIIQAIEKHRSFIATYQIKTAASGIRWIEVKGSPSYDDTGRPLRFSGSCIDVTDYQSEKDEDRHLREHQAFLLKLADVLAPLSDPRQIQIEACRVLGEHLRANRVFYAEFDESGLNRTGPQYLDGVPPAADVWHLNDFDTSLLARYREGLAVTCDDVSKLDNLTEAQRATFSEAQIAAWAAVPVVKPGMPLGRLIINQKEPRTWSQIEIDLIRETAERVWPAVQRAKSQTALELTSPPPRLGGIRRGRNRRFRPGR